ncbi:hypothetical protein ACFQ6V_32865 [Streptomyces roseifaciens]
MTQPVPSAHAVDLRVVPVDGVLDRVEQSFRVRLDRGTVVRKRRSVGARTDRGTWVRVERRGTERIDTQGWNGTETAAALHDVAMPEWYAGTVWRDDEEAVMWRADETGLLPGAPIGTSVTVVDPNLPDEWWVSLNASLDALAAQRTHRVATPDTEVITQELVTETVRSVFPGSFDTTVEQWHPAHADLNWANITAPGFCLFDWEDWGTAPRGLDAASLWGASLVVPALADRVRRERRSEFESRDGKLMTLFVAAKILGSHAHHEDPRLDRARAVADRVVKELQPG